MPIATTPPTDPTPFYVPTVDISPYLADTTSAEAEKIIADVRAACISTGFFQITGHGIPHSLQKDVFDAAAAFFALPLETKKKLDAKTTIGHRGYDVLASQSYEADVMPDLKEVPCAPTNHLHIPQTDPSPTPRVSTSAPPSRQPPRPSSPAASSWVPTSGPLPPSSLPLASSIQPNDTTTRSTISA